MKLLFVTHRFPWPIQHGTWLRVYHLAGELVRQGHEVSLLSPAPQGDQRQAYDSAGVTLVAGPHRQADAAARARIWGGPHAFDADLCQCVQRHAPSQDAVVLFLEATLQYAPEARQAPAVVADLLDDPLLESRRQVLAAGGLRPWLRHTRLRLSLGRYERRLAGDVDQFTFVSSADADSFSLRHPRASVAVVPLGVDVAYFSPPPPAAEAAGQPRVVFVGNFAHGPNEDAALFLVRDVAPRVWRQCPQAVFRLVGAAPTAPVLASAGPRVEVAGAVSDIRPHLAAATAVSVPMRTGTGVKNKLLEAWAMQCPVAATTLACQGLPARDGENLLVGDGHAGHAQAILRLIADRPLARRLGEQGRILVAGQFAWRVSANRLTELCRKHR